MKYMTYIVIAITGLVTTGVIIAVCISSSVSKPPSDIVGISLYQNHMDFGKCYSFYIREDDGKVLFDAEVRFDEEPYSIILESCEVDRSFLKEINNINKEYGISEYVRNYKRVPKLFGASDKTVNKTTVYFDGEYDSTADTNSEHLEVLYNFFLELSKKYINQSVYER